MVLKNVHLIVPVYNESKYISSFSKDLLSKLNKVSAITKVIFVNDGSSDNTLAILLTLAQRNKLIKIVSHPNNLGKGEAMKTGLKLAKKDKSDAVIFIDGDGQHNPKYLSTFVKKLETSPVVFGYRILSKEAPWVRRTGNRIAGLFIHNLFNIKRKDLLCGFMALRTDVYKKILWNSQGYGVEAEISAIVGRKSISFQEVFISTIYLDKSKGVTLWHAFKILLHLPRWYFQVK